MSTIVDKYRTPRRAKNVYKTNLMPTIVGL